MSVAVWRQALGTEKWHRFESEGDGFPVDTCGAYKGGRYGAPVTWPPAGATFCMLCHRRWHRIMGRRLDDGREIGG